MNVDLINKGIDAAIDALKSIDGSKADGSKTVLFAGSIESENGVRTVKSISGDVVSENDVNSFLDKIGMVAKTIVFAIDYAKKADEEDRKKREDEAKAEAEAKATKAEAKATEAERNAQTLRAEADEAKAEAKNPYYRRPVVKKYRKVLVEDND